MLPFRQASSPSVQKRKTEFMHRTIQPPPGFGLRTRESVHPICGSVLQSSVVFAPAPVTGSLARGQDLRISEANLNFFDHNEHSWPLLINTRLQSGARNRKSSRTASAVSPQNP